MKLQIAAQDKQELYIVRVSLYRIRLALKTIISSNKDADPPRIAKVNSGECNAIFPARPALMSMKFQQDESIGGRHDVTGNLMAGDIVVRPQKNMVEVRIGRPHRRDLTNPSFTIVKRIQLLPAS